MTLESWVLSHQMFSSSSRLFYPAHENRRKSLPIKVLGRNTRYSFPFVPNCVAPSSFTRLHASSFEADAKLQDRTRLRCLGSSSDCLSDRNVVSNSNLNCIQELLKRGIILAATVCGLLVFGCSRVFAVEGVVNAGYGVFGQSILLLRNTWPKVLQVLRIFKEQGLVLAVLLGLSAFFSMAETSITTLWPWKVRELAEKESENGVFRLLRSDVTRFLTTILIGTTVVNIGATALVTEAATAMFGEAGVSAATGVMTYINMLPIKLANS